MFNSSQKGFAQVFLLIILLIGLVIGVYGVQKVRTILKPKAYDLPTVSLVDKKGIVLPSKISDPNIYLLIHVPDNIYFQSQRQDGLIKQASAKESSTVVTAIPICSGSHEDYQNDHMDVTIIEDIPALEKGESSWTTITDETSGFTGFVSVGGGGRNIFALHDQFSSLRGSGVIMKFVPDGTIYTVKVYRAPFTTGLPDLSNLLGQTTFSINCNFPIDSPTPVPFDATPAPRGTDLLKELIIENMDAEGNSLGEPLHITSSFGDYIDKPVPWRFTDLKLDETEGYRLVRVRFIDEKGLDTTTWSFRIMLTKELGTTNLEIPVDVYVDPKYNFTGMEAWSKELINSHTNQILTKYGIKRRIVFNSIQSREVGLECDSQLDYSKMDKIAFYISNENNTIGAGDSTGHSICLGPRVFEKGTENGENGENVFVHELGHLFGLPDYYMQDVLPGDNAVVPIGITSEVKDIMWSNYDTSYAFFSENSVQIINRLPTLFPEHVEFWKYYAPKQFILQIVGNSNTPIQGIKVEVFPTIMNWAKGSRYPKKIVPKTVSFERMTDSTGRVFLGDQSNIFNHHVYHRWFNGGSAILRITHDDEVKYAVLTLTHLNNLYFAGQTNFATITVPFSQLISAQVPGDKKMFKSFSELTTESISEEERADLDKHLYEQLKESGELDQLQENHL